jgi:hypothetical protein
MKVIATTLLLASLVAALPGCHYRTGLDVATLPSRPPHDDCGEREPIDVSTTGGERIDARGGYVFVTPGDHAQQRFALSRVEELYVEPERRGHALDSHGRTFDFQLGDGSTFEISRIDDGLTAALFISIGALVAGVVGAGIALSSHLDLGPGLGRWP